MVNTIKQKYFELPLGQIKLFKLFESVLKFPFFAFNEM